MTNLQILGACLLWLGALVAVWHFFQAGFTPGRDRLWPDGEPDAHDSQPIPLSFTSRAAKGGDWRGNRRVH